MTKKQIADQLRAMRSVAARRLPDEGAAFNVLDGLVQQLAEEIA